MTGRELYELFTAEWKKVNTHMHVVTWGTEFMQADYIMAWKNTAALLTAQHMATPLLTQENEPGTIVPIEK